MRVEETVHTSPSKNQAESWALMSGCSCHRCSDWCSHSHLRAPLHFQGIFTRSPPLLLRLLGTVWSQSPSTQLRALPAWGLLPARLDPALVLWWVMCWVSFLLLSAWGSLAQLRGSWGLSPKHPQGLLPSGFPSRCTSIPQVVRQNKGREESPYFVDKDTEAQRGWCLAEASAEN